jgi:CRP/FNR family transcriptional regulator, cyclic AMP receptor protein
MAAGHAFVRVLEEDPELAAGLDPTSVQLATRHAIAAVEVVAPGRWEPSCPADGGAGSLGLLVLDGLLMRDVTIAQAACTELIGRGDLLRPWDWERDVVTIKPVVTWTALQPVRLAVLDRRITAVMGRWPELVSAVVARAVRRSFELATNQATSHLTRVDARLELLFWGLADRWGRVGPDGVVLELPLTHQVLGRLVGAQRPSVTTALSDLARRGVIERREDGAWILRGDPPGEPEDAAVPAPAEQQATPT